jgi:hypothetical protein
MERTTVRLPSDLLARARKKAAAEGRTLTSLIEEGLRATMAKASPPSSPRKLPRISKAKGGLQPGVGILRYSEIQEQDDLDYVERMKTFR